MHSIVTMQRLVTVVLIAVLWTYSVQSEYSSLKEIAIPEDAFLNVSSFLGKYNYSYETHEVATEDGFFLGLHRIPTVNTAKPAPAVLMVHGLLCSPMDWILQKPENALGLMLKDLGYDIWLLSTRGSQYSMKHAKYNESETEFWDFSFHEKGYYDIANTIDYILNITGLDQLSLVGHSEGTSASLALTSTRTEYNDKINLMVLLSPVGYSGGITSPIPVWMAKYMTELKLVLEVLNIYGIPYSQSFTEMITTICSSTDISILCQDFLAMIGGEESGQLTEENMLVFLSSKPGGMSIKQLLHYGQEMVASSFRHYDYGSLKNELLYGQVTPPDYDPKKITVPIVLYYGTNDYFAAVEDVETLKGELPNVVEAEIIDKFNHLDFIYAKDVKTLVYDKALALIKEYNVL